MKAAFCTNLHLQPTFLRGATGPPSSALPGVWTLMLGSAPVDTNAFSQDVDSNARSSRLLAVMLGSSLVARPSHQRSPKPNPIWAGLGRLGCSAGLDARLILWLNIQPLAVLARGRPPANIVHPAGVPVAWPTPHGHRRVLQPGRSRTPGATLWPHRITVHALHLRSC